MTLIYKINDLEKQIPYKQWEALKKEFVEFAKEKRQLETNRDEAIKLIHKNSKLVKKGELCHFAFYDMQMDDVSEVLEILERGKE